MSIDDFRDTLSDPAPPPTADLALQAIWWAGKGDWDRAHQCAQQNEGDPDCDLVHAHLHRREGDVSNARTWYRRSGQPVSTLPISDEWTLIAERLLDRQ